MGVLTLIIYPEKIWWWKIHVCACYTAFVWPQGPWQDGKTGSEALRDEVSWAKAERWPVTLLHRFHLPPEHSKKRGSSDWTGTHTLSAQPLRKLGLWLRHGACTLYITLWPAEDKVNVIICEHVTWPVGGTLVYYNTDYWSLISDT